VAVFLSFSEDSTITSHPKEVNLWYVIFEIASAYGNVGCSVSVYGESYSLAGVFSLAGKIAIMFTMILGKHRGLPESNDSVLDFEFKELRQATGLNVSL
jgi:Trk-type K+ transport system membrane component